LDHIKLCEYTWTTKGDGHHYSDLKHVCKLAEGHKDEPHTCQCNVETAVNGISAAHLRNRMVETLLSRHDVAPYTVIVDGKRLYDIVIDDASRTLELRGE
jgi:hypothetical protein